MGEGIRLPNALVSAKSVRLVRAGITRAGVFAASAAFRSFPMRRFILFGLIAASVLILLIIAEVRTRYAQDLIFGADIPCAEWPTLAEWEEVNREMALAADYLGGSIYTTLVFDKDAARAAGMSDEALALNDEWVSFFNAGVEDLEEGGEMMDDEEAERLLEEEYPTFKAFYDCGRYRQNPYRRADIRR